MNAPILTPGRRLRRVLLEHLDGRMEGASAAVNSIVIRCAVKQADWYAQLPDYFAECLRAGRSPMRSKREWGEVMGVSTATIKRWWRELRAFRVDGAYIFREGVHTFRRGTVIEMETPPPGTRRRKARPRRVAEAGICLRISADLMLPDWCSQEIVATTRKHTRTMSQNMLGVAQALEQSPTASDAARNEARTAVGTITHPPQLDLPGTGTDNGQ